MHSQGLRLLVYLVVLGMCVGCGAQRPFVSHTPTVKPREHRIPHVVPAPPQPVLAVASEVADGRKPGLRQAAAFVETDDGPPPPAPPLPTDESLLFAVDQAIPLTEFDCMCRAANCSPEVATILLEMQLPSTPDCKKGPTPAEVLRHRLLQLRAAEAANRASGQALQLFFGLAEARRQRELVNASLLKIDEALADVESIRDEGIAIEVDLHQLKLQRGRALRQRVEVETAIVSANSSLKLLLGEWPASDTEYAPKVEALAIPSFNRDQSASTAVAQRPDLNAARLVLSSLNQDSTMVVGMLQQAYPGSTIPVPGGACPLTTLLAIHDANEVLSVRQRQANRLVNGMERAAADEVVRYGRQTSDHLEQLTVAQQDVSRTDVKIVDLKDLRDSGRSTYFDVVRAELQRIESETETVRQRFAAESAFAKLREAEGGLAVECRWMQQCAPLSRHATPQLQEPLPLMPASYEETASRSLTIKQGMAKCFLK